MDRKAQGRGGDGSRPPVGVKSSTYSPRIFITFYPFPMINNYRVPSGEIAELSYIHPNVYPKSPRLRIIMCYETRSSGNLVQSHTIFIYPFPVTVNSFICIVFPHPGQHKRLSGSFKCGLSLFQSGKYLAFFNHDCIWRICLQ